MDITGDAIVLTGGKFDSKSAKTAHGLIRGSKRFNIKSVIDENFYGKYVMVDKNGKISVTEKKSHITDISNASRTMLFDSKKEEWSKSILKHLQIPHKILPQVKPNVYDFGYTKIFGSAINIGGMAGDQQASAIGHTCFTLGKAKSTYGTGCFLLMNIGNKFKISKNKLLTSVAY